MRRPAANELGHAHEWTFSCLRGFAFRKGGWCEGKNSRKPDPIDREAYVNFLTARGRRDRAGRPGLREASAQATLPCWISGQGPLLRRRDEMRLCFVWSWF